MPKALLRGLAGTGVRLLLVGGADSLTVSGRGGRLVAEDPAHRRRRFTVAY